MRMIAATGLALLCAIGLAQPTSAQRGNRDLSCTMIVRTEDGRFTYRPPQPGLSVLARTAPDGPLIREGLPDTLAGFACIRSSQVPDVGDIEVLQAGLSLTISGSSRELRMMTLSLTEGRVGYSMAAGAMTASETRATDAAIAEMQARLDSAATP